MAAFGAKQGGKATAHESKPRQGHVAKNTEAPEGDCCKNEDVGKGLPGAGGGFGCK